MGVYIKGITVQMLRNAPLEAVEELLTSGDMVDVPEPHGRLVDADELKTAFPQKENGTEIKIASVRATINHMPTVIESEGDTE